MGCNHSKKQKGDTTFNADSTRREALTTVHEEGISVYEDYEIISNLGVGSLGSVDLAVRKNSNHSNGGVRQKYALKSIITSRLSDDFKLELINEIKLLSILDHPHIVRLYDVYQIRGNHFLVMQCCNGGDLWSRTPYTEAEAIKIVESICSAVSYMHARQIMHRDLKFENVVFETKDENSPVRVIDFGLSKKYTNARRFMHDTCGTLYTMSPQVLRGAYTSHADNWAIGVIAYTLLSNKKPFYGRDKNALVSKILEGSYSFSGKGWKNVSHKAKLFVRQLLVVEPNERMTASEALNHEWLNSKVASMGRISTDEYKSILAENMEEYGKACELKKVALTLLAHKANSEKLLHLHNAFKKYDTGHDGVIRKSEFVEMMKQFNYANDDEIDSMFSSMDVFNDGYIQYVEFIAATLEARGSIEEYALREAFDHLDSDKSGFITKEDLRQILGKDYSDAKAEQMVKDADLNNDGKISFQEFIHQFRSQTNSAVGMFELAENTTLTTTKDIVEKVESERPNS